MTQPVPSVDMLLGDSKALVLRTASCSTTPTDIGEGSAGATDSPSLWDHASGRMPSRRVRSIASGSTGSSGIASGAGVQLMCGVIEGSSFQCSKCLLPKPIAQLRIRSGQKVCEGDVRSYASIQTRWAGNRELRSWFKGLTPLDRVDWYVKQQQNDTGKKRNIDSMMYNDTYSNKAIRREGEIDVFIPWRIYRRRALADGEDATQAAYNFINSIQNNRVSCRFHRGEWHVPEYQGLRIETGQELAQGHTVNRGGVVETAAELAERTIVGESLLKKQIDANQGCSNQAQNALRADTPSINASMAAQPAIVPQVSIVMAELNHAVTHTNKHPNRHTVRNY